MSGARRATRASRCGERERGHLGGAAQRDAHALVVEARLEASVGQHRRDRLAPARGRAPAPRGRRAATASRSAREGARGRCSATTGSRSSRGASRSRLLERRRRGPEPELALGGLRHPIEAAPRAPPPALASASSDPLRHADGRAVDAVHPREGERQHGRSQLPKRKHGPAATPTGTSAGPRRRREATTPGFAPGAGPRGPSGRTATSWSRRGSRRTIRAEERRSPPASSTRGGSRRSRGARGRRRSGRRRGSRLTGTATPRPRQRQAATKSPWCQRAPTTGPVERRRGRAPPW